MLPRPVGPLLALLLLSAISIPANAQSTKVIPLPARPAYLKFASITPSFVPQLAAARQISISLNHAAQFKGRAVKKHIENGMPPFRIVPVDDQPLAMRSNDETEANNKNARLLEVSFTSAVRPLWHAPVVRLCGDSSNMWASMDTTFTDETGQNILAPGEILIDAQKDFQLKADDCTVSMKRGSLVLISKTPSALRVTNLKDDRANSVIVSTMGALLSLKPATEMIVANCPLATSKKDGCGRRNTKIIGNSPSGCITIGEVSLQSLLINNRLVKCLNNSDERYEHKLCKELQKMTACLAHMNKSSEQFNWK